MYSFCLCMGRNVSAEIWYLYKHLTHPVKNTYFQRYFLSFLSLPWITEFSSLSPLEFVLLVEHYQKFSFPLKVIFMVNPAFIDSACVWVFLPPLCSTSIIFITSSRTALPAFPAWQVFLSSVSCNKDTNSSWFVSNLMLFLLLK